MKIEIPETPLGLLATAARGTVMPDAARVGNEYVKAHLGPGHP